MSVLHQHSDVINSVRWIENNDTHFITSSVDKSSIIWEKSAQDKAEFAPKYILKAHNNCVIISDSIIVKDGLFISASSSNNKDIVFWNNDTVIVSQNVDHFVFDIKLYLNLVIPGLVVLSGGSNRKLTISRLDLETNQLECLISLKGHNDWIRTVDLYPNQDGNVYILLGLSLNRFLRNRDDCFGRSRFSGSSVQNFQLTN